MRSRIGFAGIFPAILIFALCMSAPRQALSQDLPELSLVQEILGVEGQMQEGALVIRFPRQDLKMQIGGEPMPTALGFVSWTAWKPVGKKALVMGDLVLLQEEVNPVISALAQGGIEVTALHNHFFHEEPRLMFMHVHGMGSAETMAKAVRSALEKTSITGVTVTAPQPVLTIDTKKIEQIIGHSGNATGSVFKITIGRAGVKAHGVEITSSMGLNSWAGFVGTDEKAHVAGDIAMTAKEVNPVIRELRKGGIDVVSVHNHMLEETPRIFFLHYWGTGPAQELAQTVARAFDLVKAPAR